MSYTYSTAAIVAAQTALLGVIDGDASAAKVVIKDASNVMLAEIILADPAGVVDPATGALSLTVQTQEDAAPATGTAATAELQDGAGVVHLTVPCAQGSSPVSGQCVLPLLDITAGEPVDLVSFVIG